MNFFRYNSNPKGWKTGDCVVRSITTALDAACQDVSWKSVFSDLCMIASKKCRMPNDPHVYEEYLKKNCCFIQMKQLKHEDGTKYTIEEVANEFPKSILLVRCAHHLTCVVRGNLYDTWNCGWRTAGKFFMLDTSMIDNSNIDRFEESMLPYLED